MRRRTPSGTTALTALTVLTALPLIMTAPAGPAAASGPGGVDVSVAAGSQAQPQNGYLSNVTGTCTRHVSTTGNNANNGSTPALAWRTVTKAMTDLLPGQRACVHAGTYQEAQLVAGHSGTATTPIAITSAPGEARPVVTATSNSSLFDFTTGVGYWLVEGLDVTKNRTNGATVRVIGGHHVTVRNNILRDGKSGAAVLITQNATDVTVDNNEIHNHHRWQNPSNTAQIEFESGPGLLRADANAINVEGSGVARVLLKGNRLHDNGGDGFQCIGHHDGDGPSASDGADIDLVDNRINNNAEDAVDIKSCQRVSIRGSVSPDNPGSAADNKLYGLRPTDKTTDMPGNHSGGGAIVLHYYARHVLIENTRIWDTCGGINVGRDDLPPVDSVIIRRNLFFNLVGAAGTVGDNTCAGRGVRLTSATHVDLHDNTFDNVPAQAVMVATDNGSNTSISNDVDVWNNIISRAQTWIAVRRHSSTVSGGVTNFASERNVFWHPDGSSNHFVLEASAATIAAWRTGTGQDQSSVHADPLFVDNPAANDYYVKTVPASPALDTALANTGAPFCGAGPDIGFRERC